MDADLLRPSIRIALGAAIMAAAVALGLAAMLSPTESARYFATVGVFVFTATLGIALGWPVGIHIGVAAEAGRLARAQMRSDRAKHELATAQYRHEMELIGRGIPAVAADGPDVVIENAPGYAAEWAAYWTAALVYADSVGGVSFRRMTAFFGADVEVWRRCFAHPMAAAKFLNPVQPRVETTCAGDWTPERIRWRIDAGTGPAPLPYAPPPQFSGQTTPDSSANSGKQRVFAAEAGEQI